MTVLQLRVCLETNPNAAITGFSLCKHYDILFTPQTCLAHMHTAFLDKCYVENTLRKETQTCSGCQSP